MPRRIVDYNTQFTEFNFVSSVGGMIFGLSHILFLYIIIQTVRGGKKAADMPWDGAKIGTTALEWTLPSPPPFHSFITPPTVK
jgi:cytochrome c oxidase subunit 1